MLANCVTLNHVLPHIHSFRASRKAQNDSNAKPIPPAAFPTAVLSIDPGEVNFGICILQLDSQWLKEAKESRNPDQIEAWEIPKYKLVLWGVIECRSSQKKKKSTEKVSEIELCQKVSRAVTKFVTQYGVQLVFMEEQLDAARRNRMIEISILSCITTMNEFHPCQMVSLHAMQKFDFVHPELQNLARLAHNRICASSKSKNTDSHLFRKTHSREIVKDVMTSACHENNQGLYKYGLEFLDAASLAAYEQPLHNLAKSDDASDTLLQLFTQMPRVIARLIAQNRDADLLNGSVKE